MHILFMDESGTPPKLGVERPSYFVAAGIIVPEAAWLSLRDGFFGLKIRHKIRGEVKWRYFSPSNEDARNPMRVMPPAQRNEIRTDIYRLIGSHRAVKALGCVASAAAAYAMPSVNDQQDVYHLAYKGLSERFQYYLQDISRERGTKELGIVVADHRGSNDDKLLRQIHQKLLHSKGEFISTYDNFIEGLFLTPSHMSIGVQLADMVAGAIWRKYERNDATWYDQIEPSLRRSAAGVVDGYGIVRSPKRGWR